MITKFHNFINEKIENVILYHGSNKEFDEFDDTKISSGDSSELFGKGYYLTDNIEIAKFYGKLISKKDKITKYTDTGIFGTPVPHFSDDADEYSEKNYKVNTFRVNGNILNSKIFVLDDGFINFLKKTFKEDGVWGDKSDMMVDRVVSYMRNNKSQIRNYRGELWYVTQQLPDLDINKIVDYIKKLGYDGLKYEPDKDFEGNEHYWNYVIYNKSVIKKI
jgi:hypothetical protein